jgi:hypothetical protein
MVKHWSYKREEYGLVVEGWIILGKQDAQINASESLYE